LRKNKNHVLFEGQNCIRAGLTRQKYGNNFKRIYPDRKFIGVIGPGIGTYLVYRSAAHLLSVFQNPLAVSYTGQIFFFPYLDVA
jgi:hypothetical protein